MFISFDVCLGTSIHNPYGLNIDSFCGECTAIAWPFQSTFDHPPDFDLSFTLCGGLGPRVALCSLRSFPILLGTFRQDVIWIASIGIWIASIGMPTHILVMGYFRTKEFFS